MKKICANFRSICAIGIISCFVLFLTASAPHRVHHLFKNLPKAHTNNHHGHPLTESDATSAAAPGDNDHDHSASPTHAGATHHDQNHDGTVPTVCVLQSAAQHSHFSTASLSEIGFFSVEAREQSAPSSVPLSRFNPSPFSQRAPPKV